MNDGVSVTRLELDRERTGPEDRFQRLRAELGVTALGMNLIVLQPGQRGRVHRHREQEEIFLVLRGTLTLLLEGGEERELATHALARVAPAVRRQLVNRGDEPVAVLALGAAGEHEGRDGEAFASWDDDEPRPPQELPLPPDEPRAGEP